MKYLVMCKGANEPGVIRILLQHNCLKFTPGDLLGLVPYHARQIKTSGVVQAAPNIYPGEVTVLRIGDTLKENYRFRKGIRRKSCRWRNTVPSRNWKCS